MTNTPPTPTATPREYSVKNIREMLGRCSRANVYLIIRNHGIARTSYGRYSAEAIDNYIANIRPINAKFAGNKNEVTK